MSTNDFDEDSNLSESDIDGLAGQRGDNDVDSGQADDGNPPDSFKHRSESRYSTEEAREAALRAELESVRTVNKVIEDVVSSLEKAKNNMHTVSRTVTNASTLLNTWTRILSQTEHNQRLILNPQWQGASQDLADSENETVLRQQEAERRELEEHHRREAAVRKMEDDERRRAEAAATGGSRGARGSRGRPRPSGRGGLSGSTHTTSYVGVGGQGGRGPRPGSASSRGSGTPGRGLRGTGRGRGLGRGA